MTKRHSTHRHHLIPTPDRLGRLNETKVRVKRIWEEGPSGEVLSFHAHCMGCKDEVRFKRQDAKALVGPSDQPEDSNVVYACDRQHLLYEKDLSWKQVTSTRDAPMSGRRP